MDVNSLYNTGNLIVELRAPVNNRGNDEIIICCFSRRDGCSLRQQAHWSCSLEICCGREISKDGSRPALAYALQEMLYQYVYIQAIMHQLLSLQILSRFFVMYGNVCLKKVVVLCTNHNVMKKWWGKNKYYAILRQKYLHFHLQILNIYHIKGMDASILTFNVSYRSKS